MSFSIAEVRRVITRVGAVMLVATLAVPLAGQQPMAVQSPGQDEALKNNIKVFEGALRASVMRAGGKLGQWAAEIANVALIFAREPAVRSVPLPDNSVVFHIEVSEVLPTSLSLLDQMRKSAPRQGPTQVGVPGEPRSLPAPSSSICKSDSVDQCYTELVYQALIDTILDTASVLPLSAGQTLTVACSPIDVTQSPVLRPPSRQLILMIKGEDIVAMRQGTLSRDAARQRIIERRF
jgi:hypothetical protein